MLNVMCQIRKIITTFLLILILSLSCKAEELYNFQIDRNRIGEINDLSFLPESISKRMLYKLPLVDWVQQNVYTIFPLENKIYALRDGFFDVLVWNDSSWTNLYKGHYFGYNFGAKIFTYKDDIYALGGYGYWQTHINLLRFDSERGTWFMIPTANKPIDYTSHSIGLIGDTIITLFGEKRDQSTDQVSHPSNGFCLALNDLAWSDLYYSDDIIPTSKLIIGKKYLDLNKYIVFESDFQTKLGMFIINKVNLNVFFWERGGYDLDKSPFIFAVKNTIYYQSVSHEILFEDIDDLSFREKYIGMIEFKNPDMPVLPITIAIILSLILFIIIGYFIAKRISRNSKPENSTDSQDDYLNRLTKKILKNKQTVIEPAELHKFFEIENLSEENIRVKRAKLINDINLRYKLLTGNDLLTRQRHEGDKRYFKYYINTD